MQGTAEKIWILRIFIARLSCEPRETINFWETSKVDQSTMRTNLIWVVMPTNMTKVQQACKLLLYHVKSLRYWAQTTVAKDQFSYLSISLRWDNLSSNNNHQIKNMCQYQHHRPIILGWLAQPNHTITHTKDHMQIRKTRQECKAKYCTSNFLVVESGVIRIRMHNPQGLNYTRATSISREIIDKFIIFTLVMGFWGFGV